MATLNNITAAFAVDILNHILSNADVVAESDGRRFLLVEVDDQAFEALAALDAEREDMEDDDPAEDDDPPEDNGDECDGSLLEDE